MTYRLGRHAALKDVICYGDRNIQISTITNTKLNITKEA